MPAKPNYYPPAYSELENQHEKIPERRLLAAVLWRAINDLLPTKPTEHLPREAMRDAYQWMFERSETGPFTFFGVCEELGRCPVSIRREARKVMGTGPMSSFRRAIRKHPQIAVP